MAAKTIAMQQRTFAQPRRDPALGRFWSTHLGGAPIGPGKVAPEHRRLLRYDTMSTEAIAALPVAACAASVAHLFLGVPNAMLPEGLHVMQSWGFTYKSNLVWHKIRKDGGSDGRGVRFCFRNVTELVLFGVRGKNARTLHPGRSQVNIIETRKREHSRKPDELYSIIEAYSPGPRIELFARGLTSGWATWGHQADEGTSRLGKPMPTIRPKDCFLLRPIADAVVLL